MIPKIKGVPPKKVKIYLKENNGIFLAVYLFCVVFTQLFIKWNGKLTLLFIMLCIIIFLVFLLICPLILKKIGVIRIVIREREISRKKSILCLIFFFLFSFCTFFRWYLSYYPGAFSSDAIYQYMQAVSGQYNDWKPILQTLITFSLPWKLTGRADMIVLFQIVEYSCALAYMAYIIWKYTGMHVAILALLYILLNPVTGNIIVCPWKDVTFAIFAVLLMTYGLQIHFTDGRWLESNIRRIFFIFVLVVATFLRHNAFLFTLPLFVAVAARIGRKIKLQLLVSFLICCGLIEGCLYPMLSVEEQWYPKTRVLGVPMTVLGNVAKEAPESFDPETQEFVYSVAPKDTWETVYQSGSFNSVKWNSNQEFIDETGMIRVISMAIRTICRSPRVALKGLFELTDIVYGVDNNLNWNIQPSMGVNDMGLELQEICNRKKLKEYTEFSRESNLRYLFWYIGTVNLAIITVTLCRDKLNVKKDWNRILFALAVLIYNFGTMLLLSGNDFRFFYFDYPVLPPLMLLLLGERAEIEEMSCRKLVSVCKKWILFIIPELNDKKEF